MCGIAGILRRDNTPVDRGVLKRMTDSLAHRGPDGEGFHLEGPVALGHRRLAIIDLKGGVQPMASEDGFLWISYNGEVYNFRELRSELEALGQRFQSASDTEVVLSAYRVWGPACVTRLRGMFAFAIWDAKRRQMLLARDRVGIKPLVYSWDGRSLRFASEIKAILQDPEVPRELDRDALMEYFTYLCVPSPRTIFRGIRKLPPASYLLCSLDGGEPEVHRYWDVHMAPNLRLKESDWIDSLDHTLREAVKIHLVSDVPLGAFLSGGLDSSSVVACMAQASAGRVKTFSIGFDEADFDELAYARQVASRYGTDHVEMIVKPDVMSVLPRLSWQFDEPFADASAVPTYCVAKIARDHVTVALSGDGGDESFAGYRRYAEAMSRHRWMDAPPLSATKPLLRLIAAAHPLQARGHDFVEVLGLEPLARYHRQMTYQRPSTLAGLLNPDVTAGTAPRVTPEAFGRLAGESGSKDYLSTLQYLDIRQYLPEDILTKVDRTTMLTSLEARVPLVDHVLMEHAATIPSGLKLRDGIGKYILKQTMRPHLPGDILSRRKMGFGVPLAKWFREDLRDFSGEILADGRTRQRGILNPDAVDRLLRLHLSGRRDHSAQLWSIICFELWCRTWWDR
jgi:asparagine synthase (glutamine-hydrolysing)